MGCTTNKDNTKFLENIKKYTAGINEIKLINDKLLSNNDATLNYFLISVKSIPNFYKIIIKNIINKEDISEDLYNYILEENIKIYDDINECKTISNNDNEINEFIIAGDNFKNCMGITIGKKVIIEKINSIIYINFENERDKMIVESKSNILYKFNKFDVTYIIQNDNYKYITKLEELNQSDVYMFICVINTLINIDVFKNLFLNDEQKIKNNNNREISNIFLDIIKKDNENLTKELINLYKNFMSKKIISESKLLIQLLIKQLFKEFEQSNSIRDLFGFQDRINYKCENCNYKYYNPQDDCLYLSLNFILEYVIDSKAKKNINFIDINIKDCFFHELMSRNNKTYKCQSNSSHKLRPIYNILKFPKLLIFTLDRGKNEATYEDIVFDIEFELNLKNLERNNQEVKYKLIGIISYKKDTELVNKYYNVSFYKDTNNNDWYFYEKNTTKKIENMNKDIIHTPYMLFYLKE